MIRTTATTTTFHDIPNEVLMQILLHLTPTEILLLSSTCQKMRSVIQNHWFWTSYHSFVIRPPSSAPPAASNSLASSNTNSSSVVLSTKELQQCCVVAHLRNSLTEAEWFSSSRFSSVRPKSVLPSYEQIQKHKKKRTYCLSSTQDNVTESITNVLKPFNDDWTDIHSEREPRRTASSDDDEDDTNKCWWSSAPNDKKKCTETKEDLLFVTQYAKVIITEIAIHALQDPFEFEFPLQFLQIMAGGGRMPPTRVYSWPKFRIRIYNLPLNDRKDFVHAQSLVVADPNRIDGIVNTYKPTYDSSIINARSTTENWQLYTLPNGIVGNVVIMTLLGKNQRQFSNSGYYVCVERVAVRGFPIVGGGR